MVWSKSKERPKRYLISVGRDRLREKVMEDLWQVVDLEGSSMADEVWDALYMHVERHRELLDSGDGRVMMEKGPQPDMSMPDEENVFDDVVANESYEAQEDLVEEVLDEERTESRRVDSRNMFGHKGNK